MAQNCSAILYPQSSILKPGPPLPFKFPHRIPGSTLRPAQPPSTLSGLSPVRADALPRLLSVILMGMAFPSVLGLLMMLLGSGVNDLASVLSTDAYWKAKGVTVSVDQLIHELDAVKPADVSKLIDGLDADDPKVRDAAAAQIAALGPAVLPALEEAEKNSAPEVATRAKAIAVQVRAASKAGAVRRLMAIRTLGEMKEKQALPKLQGLLDSKEMFVAEYARAAVAKIEGKEVPSTGVTDAERATDLGLLPSKLDLAAQVALRGGGEFSIEKIIDSAPMPDAEKAKAKAQATAGILQVLESVGNVRVDSVTVGFYAGPPGVPAYGVFVVHGTFDSHAAAVALHKQFSDAKAIDGVEVFKMDAETSIMVPSDHRAMLLTGEQNAEIPVEAMIAASKKNAGEFADNAELQKILKGVDTKAPLWMAANMTEGLKQVAGPLASFDTVILVATQKQDGKDIVTDLRLDGTGPDAATAKTAAGELQNGLQQSIQAVQQMTQGQPAMKPVLEFLQSIKVQTDADKASVTGSLRGMPLLPFIAGTRVIEEPAPPGQ
ncbi:MAG: hypothetical protein JWN24_3607 [Phycisphaerales bacterium]|nr:hypothetical protein [Phycisphaerales bacterium]